MHLELLYKIEYVCRIPEGFGWDRPLLSLQTKYCFMILLVWWNDVDVYFASKEEITDIVYDLDKD